MGSEQPEVGRLMLTEAEACAALDVMIQPSFRLSLITLDKAGAIRVRDTMIEVDLVMNCSGAKAREITLALAHTEIERLQAGVMRPNLLRPV